MTTSVSISKANKVIAITKKNEAAKDLFAYLASRERNPRGGCTPLGIIERQMNDEGFKPMHPDLLATFKELEQLQIGEMVGNAFRWKVGMKELAKRVYNQTPSTFAERHKARVPLENVVLHSETKPQVQEIHSNAQASTTLLIKLTAGRKFKAELPSQLTKEEIKFIADSLAELS